MKTSATETPSCPHYVAFQGRHGYPADQAGNAANKPELCFHCELHGGRVRGLCSGGLSLIIAPGTHDRACLQLHRDHKKRALIRDEDGREADPPPHAIHCTSSPSWQECEVFLSRTWPANSNPWLAATLLSITNTRPIYPSAPNPHPPLLQSHCHRGNAT